MDHLPREVAALLRHGAASTTDIKAVIGERGYDHLITYGLLARRPGHVAVDVRQVDRWTPLVEVEIRCPGAVASGRLAAWLYRAPPFDSRTPPHLDHLSRRATRVPGVRVTKDLAPCDVTDVGGVAVTTAARTLADLGNVVDDDTLERVGESLLHRRLTTEAELAATALRLRRRGRASVAALQRFMKRRRLGTPPTESDLETRFLQVARRLGFPEPTWRQFRVGREHGGPLRVDFVWRRGCTLVFVEVDGAGAHANPQALMEDLRRQNVLQRSRPVLLRFSADDIDRHPHNILRELGLHVTPPPTVPDNCSVQGGGAR